VTYQKKSFGESLGEAYRQIGPFLNLGTELAASVGGMLFLGYLLDKQFGTSPWLLLAGAAIGLTGGFYNFFKTVQKIGKNNKFAGRTK
jgi:ATP synthase protein I